MSALLAKQLSTSFDPAGNAVLMRRKCACGPSGSGSTCAACEEQEGTVRRRAATDHTPATVPPSVYSVLRAAGRPLDAVTRAHFESRFAHDFSQVRVHTEALAAASASAVNALAYTVGHHLVFAQGQYAPQHAAGASLMAHELAHVVQQAGRSEIPSRLEIGPDNDAAETQAEQAASSAARSYAFDPVEQQAMPRTVPPLLQRKPIHEGRVLDEGTCADLVAGSRFICCDPTNGIERKGRKKDVDGTPCPSEKFTSIFTCDKICERALAKGCSDTDNWMAMPKDRFALRKCDQDLVICTNGKFTHGYVRDRSDRQAWEASRAIPTALGVSPDFRGAIYSDENDPAFKKDTRCHPAPAPKPKAPQPKTPKPKSTSVGEGATGNATERIAEEEPLMASSDGEREPTADEDA